MKYALVTGGTKGIGKAISNVLIEKGYFVIINYANDDEVANTIFKELNFRFPNHSCLIKADLSHHENINDFCQKIRNVTDHLDVLILNAGMTDRTPFGETEYKTLLSVFETNLFSPYFIIHELHTIMSKNSSIIITGSVMGIYPHSMSVSYGVSKAAVHALVENLVKFLAPLSIRINAIAPGFIDTEWQKDKSVDIRKNIENKIAIKRFGTTQEVAEAILFLISNKYINGEIIKIDGAYSYK